MTENFELAKWTLGATWTASGAVWAASKLVPTKNNQIVAIHPGIDGEKIAEIKAIEGITESINAKDMSMEELQKELTKLSTELRLQERTPSIHEYLRAAIIQSFYRAKDLCTGLAIQFQYVFP